MSISMQYAHSWFIDRYYQMAIDFHLSRVIAPENKNHRVLLGKNEPQEKLLVNWL
jgi:hypothetical protein